MVPPERRALVLLASLALAPLAPSQTSALIALPSSDPQATAARLLSDGYDVLPDLAPGGALQLIVTPEELATLTAAGFAPEVLARGRPYDDIQAEQPPTADGSTPSGYPTLAQIDAQLAVLAAVHPDLCVLVDLTAKYGLPPTFEGRHLHALRISDHAAVDEDEPTVLVVCTHHSRELVGPVIGLDAAQRLLTG
ncbi:MAG TPA: M14 family zinc carboxypeptidase, partial [Planctomycetota bacterium]|nr:M14 family zinc carboxypeptidase [Planctomycetota bacterium]